MYAKFNKMSVLDMFNSELFLAGEDEGNELDVMKRPMLGFQEECNSAASEQEVEVEDEGKEEVRNSAVRRKRKNKEDTDTAVSEKSGNTTGKLSLGEFEVTVGDNDEGFRTPTSQDHRIPVVKECPPAPRKPKPPSRKRKASPNTGTSQPLLNLSEEVASLFPKPDFHRNNQKARREEN